MHEASLMADLMHQIEDVARSENARRVIGVSVWLGALSHMSAAHFAEHFEQVSGGTIAEEARLDTTVSDDMHHVHAQDILLERVEIET